MSPHKKMLKLLFNLKPKNKKESINVSNVDEYILKNGKCIDEYIEGYIENVKIQNEKEFKSFLSIPRLCTIFEEYDNVDNRNRKRIQRDRY